MKRMIALLIVITAFLTMFALPSNRAYAGICNDGGTYPDPPGSLSDAERAAYKENICGESQDSSCAGGGNFLSFPKWYKYLDRQPYTDKTTGVRTCAPKLGSIYDVWKILAAVIELITRLASLVAVAFVVYGGVTYTLSQGNPDKTKQALKTIINALVGLAIAIISTALVSFIAGRFN